MTWIIPNQSSQPVKSITSSMQTRSPFNKTNHMGLDWMGLTTFGLYGIALARNCLYCFIDCMVLGWVELLDLMVTLDCVGYALSGLDLIHWGFFFSFCVLTLYLTWLGFNWLHWLIDCFLFFLSPLHYDIVWLPYKHWDLARGWLDWLVRVIDVIRLIGAIRCLTLNWIDWFCGGSVIFSFMWICCWWLWFESLVSLMSFD